MALTREAAGEEDADSYLPFVGNTRLCEAAARHVSALSGMSYSRDNVVIAAGGLSGVLNALLALVEVGDEVIVTDPTYAGLLNRVRLACGVPVAVPFSFHPGEVWRLDRNALRGAVTARTRVMLLMSPLHALGQGAGHGGLGARLRSLRSARLPPHLRRRHGAAAVRRAGGSPPGGTAGPGWTVAPDHLMPDLGAVSLANVVVPVGIAGKAAAVAVERSSETLPAYVAELERCRNTVADELRGLSFGMPAGGWSLLLDVRPTDSTARRWRRGCWRRASARRGWRGAASGTEDSTSASLSRTSRSSGCAGWARGYGVRSGLRRDPARSRLARCATLA